MKSRAITHFGCLLFLTILLNACATDRQASFHVINQGQRFGIHSSYENTKLFKIDYAPLFALFIESLVEQGAQILVADVTSGIISWSDPGATFITLPVYMKKRAAIGLAPSTAIGMRNVYGSARLRTSAQGTWIFVRSVGREVHSEKVALSDGSYERTLFKSVERKLKRKKEITLDTERISRLPLKYSLPPAQTIKSYTQLFAKHFRNLKDVAVHDIQEGGTSKTYPNSVELVWSACLDIISQYDTLARVSSIDKVIVFFEGITVPHKINKKKIQYFDVFMALHLEPKGEEGTLVHLVFLEPHNLQYNAVFDVTEMPEDELQEKLRESPRKVAASLIAEQFYGQLTTQLYHEDRWKDKFKRRYSES